MIDFGSIETIPGFRWGFQVGADGTHPVGTSRHNPGEQRNLAEQFFTLWQTLPRDITLADYSFQNGRVFVRVVPGGIVVLFCDKLVRRSIISTALDSIFNHGNSSTILTSPVGNQGSGSQVLSAGDADSKTVTGTSSGAGRSHISFGNGDALPGTVIPEEIVKRLIGFFTEELGPLAPMVARKTCKKEGMSLDSPLQIHWSKLLNLLAEVIDNPEKRDRFLDKAILLRKEF